MTTKTQIVIAGAGPVGCVIGLILARAGISVRILESESDLIPELRASTFHPPTLVMLDELGVTPKLIAQGLITPKIQYRDLDDGLVAEFDHALIDDRTKHPYRLQCEQFKLTRIIAEMLKNYSDAEISFNSKFTNAAQTDDDVTVKYDTPDGPTQITCDYLIGADGSRSEVRKSQNIEFKGFTYPEQFVTVSVPDDIDAIVPGMGHVCYIAHPTEWCALIHAPDYWRFLFPISMEILHFDRSDLPMAVQKKLLTPCPLFAREYFGAKNALLGPKTLSGAQNALLGPKRTSGSILRPGPKRS